MKEIKPDIPYQPVSCEIHSEYELAIMLKNKIFLTWRKDGEVVTETNVTPLDVKTMNKAEYLVVQSSEQTEPFAIRLDCIIEMRSFT